MRKITLLISLILPLSLFAVQYHSIGTQGNNLLWSNTNGGGNCNCAPNWGNDSIFLYHSTNQGSVNWNSGSYLHVGNGGEINIGNNSNWTVNSKIFVDSNGAINTSNNFDLTINGSGSFEVGYGGSFVIGNNLNVINNGTFIIRGSMTSGNNADIFFQGGSDVKIDGTVDVGNGSEITNETSITGTGTIINGGTFENRNGGDINGCTDCSTNSPLELVTQTPNGEITDATIYREGAWSNGTPDATLNMVVIDDLNLNTQSFNAMSLIVDDQATLTIGNGRHLSLSDSVDNNGTIEILNGGGLIQTGNKNNTGNGTYKLAKAGTAGQLQYNKWSSPIPGQKVTDVFPDANLYDVYVFDENAQAWKYDFGTTAPENNHAHSPYSFNTSQFISGADGIMDVGRGYFVPGSVMPHREFEGNTINNGTYNVDVVTTSIPPSGNWTGSDWNLIGNPYPSPISIQDFLTVNFDNNGTVANAIHLWDNTNSQYNAKNITDAEFLTSCQGFWVDASVNGTVEFNNSMRGWQNNLNLRGGSDYNDLNGIYLSVNDTSLNDQIRIYVSDNADDGIDNLFDAKKMQNGNGFNFYSKIDTGNFVFQSVTPATVFHDKRINLGMTTVAETEHIIKVDSLISGNNNFIYLLIDHKLDETHELSQGDEIAFDVEADEVIDDRFELVIRVKTIDEDVAIGHEDHVREPELISSNESLQVLNNENTRIEQLQIFDVSGRLVQTLQNIEAGSTKYSNQLKTGVYIVRYQYENKSPDSKKVYVK